MPQSTRQNTKFLSDEEVEKILEALPHGSGIDSKWEHRAVSNKDKFTNSIHCMDENGYYDDWQDFSVLIFRHEKDVEVPLRGPFEGKTQTVWRKGDRDFKITFSGRRREKYIQSWREPLYEMIGHALEPFGIGRMRNEVTSR